MEQINEQSTFNKMKFWLGVSSNHSTCSQTH